MESRDFGMCTRAVSCAPLGRVGGCVGAPLAQYTVGAVVIRLLALFAYAGRSSSSSAGTSVDEQARATCGDWFWRAGHQSFALWILIANGW